MLASCVFPRLLKLDHSYKSSWPGEEGGPSVPPGTPFHEAVGRSCGDSGNPQVDDCEFLDTIDSILKWLAWITVPIIVIVIIYAGIQMSMAGGNSQAFQAPRTGLPKLSSP